ncbi:hypothetical protein L210DRAFT_3200745 [Boletus edulis BED1]|uniref:DUF6533 domain-containing protein n=1 Tax=Boletus edulis BED1 TaxID=1328754 RepID=A0AAD4BXB0_BOLED|nr:hypothetical protein L210DRAFT_3200745 [Boletus edulis BED1]
MGESWHRIVDEVLSLATRAVWQRVTTLLTLLHDPWALNQVPHGSILGVGLRHVSIDRCLAAPCASSASYKRASLPVGRTMSMPFALLQSMLTTLQQNNSLSLAILTAVGYDYVLTFSNEIEYIWVGGHLFVKPTRYL